MFLTLKRAGLSRRRAFVFKNPHTKLTRICLRLFNDSASTYLLTYLLTIFMEQRPSWEANRFSATQEIPHILWNLRVHYRNDKRPPPVSVLSQINPILCKLQSYLASNFVATVWRLMNLNGSESKETRLICSSFHVGICPKTIKKNISNQIFLSEEVAHRTCRIHRVNAQSSAVL